ncbi:MAG: aldo/keto reductase [Candidatus Margulisbacteria bacterium]|nr:aldo/keto reductase [Candidatus Margulisiibacteriota bacterium]
MRGSKKMTVERINTNLPTFIKVETLNDQAIELNGRVAQAEFDKYELLTQETMDKVKKISAIAKELGATTAQLGTAWCLKNPHVSSVIVGASSVEQLKENLKAAEVKEKITSEILEKIRGIIS